MFRPVPNLEWRLASDVHATEVDDDLVFLDVRRDAYVCLPTGARLASLHADGRNLTISSDVAPELQAAGLIEPGQATFTDPVVSWARPSQSALLDHHPRVRWADVGKIAQALTLVSARYRRRTFDEIVASARRSRTQAPTSSPALIAAVHDFHRWIPYAPLSGKCLLRSFLLLSLLRSQGFDALWVFGVRLWPFAAHCWLQCDDIALDEQPDRIRSFTPILVV